MYRRANGDSAETSFRRIEWQLQMLDDSSGHLHVVRMMMWLLNVLLGQ